MKCHVHVTEIFWDANFNTHIDCINSFGFHLINNNVWEMINNDIFEILRGRGKQGS